MKNFMRALWLTTGIVVFATAVSAATLDDVKKRGFIQCGASTGVTGFSWMESDGKWSGIDIDTCSAVAAAVFGDAAKTRFTPLSSKERFAALQSGAIDMLSRNTTWSLSFDTTQGLNFVGINYYDGQGFMVRKSLNIKSATELEGASVCTQSGTTNVLNMASFFAEHKIKYTPVTFDVYSESLAAYDAGRCDAFTADASNLAGLRLRLTDPNGSVVLPDLISKEPLGPMVRQGDDAWFHIVRWSLFALISAEELGITQANVTKVRDDPNASPEAKRLLGVGVDLGAGMGLSKDWAYNIIKAVGNYGEVYERNLGMQSVLKIPRGLNNLWTKGGLHYAPPVR